MAAYVMVVLQSLSMYNSLSLCGINGGYYPGFWLRSYLWMRSMDGLVTVPLLLLEILLVVELSADKVYVVQSLV